VGNRCARRKRAYNRRWQPRGEMAERLNAAVLKTAERDERSVGSNPTLSSTRVTSYTSRKMIMEATRLSSSAAIVVLIVAGCSNEAPSAPEVPVANLVRGDDVAASFGEVLSAKRIIVKKQLEYHLGAASGSATTSRLKNRNSMVQRLL
jgi:hypothetical protein